MLMLVIRSVDWGFAEGFYLVMLIVFRHFPSTSLVNAPAAQLRMTNFEEFPILCLSRMCSLGPNVSFAKIWPGLKCREIQDVR